MPNDDLESRFSRLEHEVTLLREDVASSQLEQGQQIDDLRQEIGGLRQEMSEEIGGLRHEMREGFAVQSIGMTQITALLTTIAGPEHGGS